MRKLKAGIHRISGKDVLVEADQAPREGQPARENIETVGPSENPELPGIPLTRLAEGVHRISGEDVLVEPETTPTTDHQPSAANPEPTEEEGETALEKQSSKLAKDATKTDPHNSKP